MICRDNMRKLLDDKVFKIIARWIKKAKQDGYISKACMLHAHLSFLYKNVETVDLDARVVFSLLASQIYLFNNYRFDLDVCSDTLGADGKPLSRTDQEDVNLDLGVPHVELFGMYQANRLKLMTWLNASGNLEAKNVVMDAIVQLVEEGDSQSKKHTDASDQRITRNWISIKHPHVSFQGAEMVLNLG